MPASPRMGVLFLALPALLALGTPGPQAGPPGLSGVWRLESQSRSEQGPPLPLPDAGGRLECAASAVAPGCRLLDARSGRSTSWPGLLADAGPIAVQVEERRIDAMRGALFARYRALLPGGDRRVLRIEESYRLSPDGATLEGTVAIFLEEGGEAAGSWRLARRWRREP